MGVHARHLVIWLREIRLKHAPFLHRLRNAIIAGIVIKLSLLVAHQFHFQPLSRAEDHAFDWVMAMQSNVPRRLDQKAWPFVWLDIDDKTHDGWGAPDITPRDKLCQLVDFATKSDAKAIVMDIDLRRPGVDHEAAIQLYNYMEAYPKTAPPLILARNLTAPEGRNALMHVQPSFLDDLVAETPNIQWAATTFSQDEDFQIRRWRLEERVLAHDGTEAVLPSVQVALQRRLGHEKEASASLHSRQQTHGARDDHEAHAAPTAQRLIYTIPWKLPEGSRRPLVANGIPLLRTLSAHLVTDINSVPSGAMLKDSIVVIGGSFAESRDIYPTPLGPMPGCLVLINAVHAYHQYGAVDHPSFWMKTTIIVGMIILMGVAFVVLRSFWAMLLSGLFLIAALLPITFYAFHRGVWLDFAAPLLGVLLHYLHEEFEAAKKGIGASH